MASFLAFLQALPAFIASLPYLFQVLLKLISLLEKFVLWAEQKGLNAWLSDLEGTIDKIDQAKTPEEKRSAAKDLALILRKLRE